MKNLLLILVLLMSTSVLAKREKKDRSAKREARQAKKAERKAKKESKCLAKGDTHEWTGRRCKKKKIQGYKLGSKKCKSKKFTATKLGKGKYFADQGSCESALQAKCSKKKNRVFENGQCKKKGKITAWKMGSKKCKQKKAKESKIGKGKYFADQASCTAALEQKCNSKRNREYKNGKCQKKGQEKVTVYALSGKKCKQKSVKKKKVDKKLGKKFFMEKAGCDAALAKKCERSGKRVMYKGKCTKKSKVPESALAGGGQNGSRPFTGYNQTPGELETKEGFLGKHGDKLQNGGKMLFEGGKGLINKGSAEGGGLPGSASDNPKDMGAQFESSHSKKGKQLNSEYRADYTEMEKEAAKKCGYNKKDYLTPQERQKALKKCLGRKTVNSRSRQYQKDTRRNRSDRNKAFRDGSLSKERDNYDNSNKRQNLNDGF